MTPVRVGLIGAGPWARAVTGPVFAAGPETELVGVWSRTAEHAGEAASALGVERYEDVDALIAACDAVAIAVTPDAQPALAMRAVEAGRSVLLEKPLAADLAAAQRLTDAIDARGRRLAPHAHLSLPSGLPPFAEAAAALDALGGWGCFLSGAFLPGSPYARGWRLERGALLDVGPHLLDLHEVAFGEIVDIDAAGDRHGWVALTLTHASGITSQGSLCCRLAMESRTAVECFGTSGTARFDGRDGDRAELGANIRRAFADVARGGTHPSDARRGLHLQTLIDRAERGLAQADTDGGR